MQSFAGRTSGRAFARRAGRCAAEIDARYGRGAHSLFATAYAADDLAAVLRALQLGKIDLYGDSYGTFFVQDFIARHPSTLHSVILDSAYPRRDLDPWYASSGAAARVALETVSPGSVAAAGRAARASARRRRSRATRATPTRASLQGVRVDPRVLADMVQDTRVGPGHAARARRLGAGRAGRRRRAAAAAGRAVGHRGTTRPPDADYFSRGAYLAVSLPRLPARSDVLRGRAGRRSRRSPPPSG